MLLCLQQLQSALIVPIMVLRSTVATLILRYERPTQLGWEFGCVWWYQTCLLNCRYIVQKVVEQKYHLCGVSFTCAHLITKHFFRTSYDNTPIGFDERVTFQLQRTLVHVNLLHCMQVQLCNDSTQVYVQIMQHTHIHRPVTGCIEAKKLLSS